MDSGSCIQMTPSCKSTILGIYLCFTENQLFNIRLVPFRLTTELRNSWHSSKNIKIWLLTVVIHTNCDDQSYLHVFLRSSNTWSFIYSLAQLEKAVRPNLFAKWELKTCTPVAKDQGSTSWGIKGSFSTFAIVRMAWQRLQLFRRGWAVTSPATKTASTLPLRNLKTEVTLKTHQGLGQTPHFTWAEPVQPIRLMWNSAFDPN